MQKGMPRFFCSFPILVTELENPAWSKLYPGLDGNRVSKGHVIVCTAWTYKREALQMIVWVEFPDVSHCIST